jgi:ubiquinone/menaquinone biosynthesis C-methylase UbiE
MKSNLSQQRVNYDTIAHLYDEPLRDYDVDENLVVFLAERPSLSPAHSRILDMGCGTGKQLSANRSQFPEMSMFGMDLFGKMLQIAQKRHASPFLTNADNMAAPFADNTFHYITNQFSYPHVQDKVQFFAEVWRILKNDGRFVITNIDPWQMPNWLIYRYFPAAQKLDFADFLPVVQLSQRLQEAGFSNLQFQRQQLAPNLTLADFYQYASARHRSSEFMAISDAAYTAGLQNIQSDLERYGAAHVLKSQVCLLTIRGDK